MLPALAAISPTTFGSQEVYCPGHTGRRADPPIGVRQNVLWVLAGRRQHISGFMTPCDTAHNTPLLRWTRPDYLFRNASGEARSRFW